jgi:short-subunit dehydrogenase
LELALHYLREGWRVAVCGRDLTKLPKMTELTSERFKAYEVDVSDKEKLKESMQDFCPKNLDLVIANAGISVGNKSAIPDFDRTRVVLNTNIIGVINTFEPAFEIMKARGKGQLVAVASVAGMVGLPGAGPYSGAKSAIIKLCESYYIDWRQFGLNVTCICPGFVDTPLTQVNPHPMPFLMSSTKAIKLMTKAIARKKALFIFPWQMNIVISILSAMPRWLYRLVMGVKFFNFSKEKTV